MVTPVRVADTLADGTNVRAGRNGNRDGCVALAMDGDAGHARQRDQAVIVAPEGGEVVDQSERFQQPRQVPVGSASFIGEPGVPAAWDRTRHAHQPIIPRC
jgi:hypothetical protein